MTNLVLALWIVVLTNVGTVTTNLVVETTGPQKVSVPLGPLLSLTAVTNIARAEVTNALARITNSTITVTGTNVSFTLTPKP